MTAVLAVATVLAAGLTVLPESVQEAQAANPCNIDTTDIDAEEVGNNCDFYGNTEIDESSGLLGRLGPSASPCNTFPLDVDAEEVGNNCDFYGNLEINEESSELLDRPPFPFPGPFPEE
jgi:hypothetical protein